MICHKNTVTVEYGEVTKEVYLAGMRIFDDLKKARWYARERGLMVISSRGNVIYDYRDDV